MENETATQGTPATTGNVTTPLQLDVFNLYRVNQTDSGDNSEVAKALAVRCEQIKQKAAELLSLYQEPITLHVGNISPDLMGEHNRRKAVAKTELETSVMWAVKSLFVNHVA